MTKSTAPCLGESPDGGPSSPLTTAVRAKHPRGKPLDAEAQCLKDEALDKRCPHDILFAG